MATMLETAKILQQGTADPVRLTRAALAAAERSEHVFIALLQERARAQAEASAARYRQRAPLSRLDGIPYAVKDLIDVAGSRTTAGSITRADSPIAVDDAPVIASLTALGMIPIGKTNLTEFAYSGLGLNPHFGTPTADLPLASPRVPGGSSSGSAIAVQRAIVSVAIGTDTAGSIRIPAAFNGLVGFRASTGRYRMEGVHPLATTLDSLGPFARTVADCAVFDAAMRGLDPLLPEAADLRRLRLVVEQDVLADPQLQPAVRANLLATVERLRQAGARVEPRSLPAIARTRELIARLGWLGAIEAWRLLGAIVEGPEGLRLDHRVRARLLAAKGIDSATEGRIRNLRLELMSAIRRELGGAILVMPTVKHVAPPLAALEGDDALFASVNLETLSLTMVGSLLDMPGVAMPSGKDAEGLPTSVLFSMPRGEDEALLGACLAVERALGGPCPNSR
ncbi:2-amino-5-chloromuconic acid deaminase [compost metagenome]